ncbi:MAG TPA: hypothetical protein VEF72_04740 [Mycobacterium sp.]|nr:hypothetical protein [Mycobacterium sp.]
MFVTAALVHADIVHDIFLNALAAQGITGQRDQLIAAGHTVATTLPGEPARPPG